MSETDFSSTNLTKQKSSRKNNFFNLNFIVSRENFQFLYVIGKGGFGKVWKVQDKKTKKYYALKEMSKLKIIDKKSIKSIKSELELLSNMESPYIVNMHFAFQDKENLYLIMDYLSGGDLRFHISRHKKFSEEQTRFFICGIILSLEYIHSKNIIHRDIKPENLVLEKNGYLRVTDFGIAKKIKNNSNTSNTHIETSGTPGYMSPEVMKSLNHSFCADFFAIGVMGYEFMKGERPYNGKNRKEIKEQIMKKQAEIKIEDLNENWTKESADFINKLLIREPENRLGYNNINELKEHPWLKYYPWALIKDKKLPSPFIPENEDNFDKRYCESDEKFGEETNIRYQEILMKENIDNIFNNFYFNENEDKRRIKKKKLDKNKINNKGKENNIYDIRKILRKKIDNNSKRIKLLEEEKENINYNKNVIKINNDKKKKNKIKHFKSGSISGTKNGNMIYINFSINNNTNNNIIGNGNNINNFYISNKNQNSNDINIYNDNNPQTERVKYILKNKLPNTYQTYSETINNNNTNIKINNNSVFLGLNRLSMNNINSPFHTSIRNIIQKKSLKNQSKDNSLITKNLSKQNILLQLNTQKNVNNKNININYSFKNKKNISLNKTRHTFSNSLCQNDFDTISTKKIKETINNKISGNNELNYKSNVKKIYKIPINRVNYHISKNDYDFNNERNNETIPLNSKREYIKRRICSEEKYNSNKDNKKNNNIKIKYSIQEILNIDKNNIKNKKMNYIYSKKSLLERKNNQFNFPILKSNTYQKSESNFQHKDKNNILKIKGERDKINIISQINIKTNSLNLKEEEKNNKDKQNEIKSSKTKVVVEKIKVNKMFL